MKCKNCNEAITGKFCGECGQNTKVGRITFGSLFIELSENVFQVNKGFFFTLKELFLHPGDGIRDYLSGKRKNYFKPIGYVLILSTLYFLLSNLSSQNTWIDSFFSGWTEYSADSKEKIMPPYIRWASNNYAYITLTSIPIFSLASYIFFLKGKANYIEHIVLNAYITGQQAIIYSMFTIVKYVCDFQILELLPFIISVGFNIWAFNQFFKKNTKIKNTIRIIFTYLLYIILFFFISLLIIGQSSTNGISIEF